MVLVFGATGYVGRYLCPYLKSLGYDVLALGRSKNGQEFLENHGIRFQYFDMQDESAFEKLEGEKVEAIVDLSACLAELETPVSRFFDVNTLGVYRVLEYARKNDIKKVIVTSSHKLYNNVDCNEAITEDVAVKFRGDHTPYIISKLAAEKFVEYYNDDFDMQGIVLRLTGVHGYGEILGHLENDGSYKKSTFEIFFEKALRGEDIEVWGDTSVVRDHVYIKDVLGAIEASIKSDNAKGIYNVASGVGYSQYDEACALAKVFAVDKVSKVTIRPELPGLTRGYVYSVEKIARDMGWKPQYVDLVDMLTDYKKEWMSKEYHNFHYIKEEDRPLTV